MSQKPDELRSPICSMKASISFPVSSFLERPRLWRVTVFAMVKACHENGVEIDFSPGMDSLQKTLRALRHEIAQKDLDLALKDAEIEKLKAEIAGLRKKTGAQ